MFAVIGIALEFAQLAPKIIDAGIDIAELWNKIKAGLDSVDPAQRDAQWAEADAAVSALKARALDPSTDAG